MLASCVGTRAAMQGGTLLGGTGANTDMVTLMVLHTLCCCCTFNL
jgi:hypothetical protein